MNRVYDSAGPDGRVRGTPIQVIEKYQALAHDNSLAGDRVAMENFQQHAEHYIRLMNEAQRQIAERREQQTEGQNKGSGQDANGSNGQSNSQPNGGQNRSNAQPQAEDAVASDAPRSEPQSVPVVESDQTISAADDGGLVVTPEDEATRPKPAKPRRPRRPKSQPAEAKAEESPQVE